MDMKGKKWNKGNKAFIVIGFPFSRLNTEQHGNIPVYPPMAYPFQSPHSISLRVTDKALTYGSH